VGGGSGMTAKIYHAGVSQVCGRESIVDCQITVNWFANLYETV
jgi:hypothetical protein